MMKLLSLAFAIAGCSSSAAPPLPVCSPTIPSTATASVGPTGSGACTEAGAVSIAAASDLVVDGYTVVGPAFTFSATGPYPHGIDFVLPYTASKVIAAAENQIVVLGKHGTPAPHAMLVSNIAVESAYGKVHFHSIDTATYQIAIPNGAGVAHSRHYAYRALGGVSMGGLGSSVNFWKHPERYDGIGVMGSDPGPDLTYTLGMIHDFFLAGFCTVPDDGAAKLGMLCPTRAPLADQNELPSSFEAFPYQAGQGVGLTLHRSLYVRANRDLARALGNGAYYNASTGPSNFYLPGGIDPSVLARTNADICANPVKLSNFYDRAFNPDGSQDVITFCDGNDGATLGFGVFDPSVPATDFTQILLAVDLNKNGKRDSGEPVIVQGGEFFQDVGTDGLADKDEPGYDANTNPDPNGDDYHYLWNPTGTEKNWRYDQGEPFDDFGVDGVQGTCQATAQNGCFDYGEGNGKYDYAPAQQNWRDHDPHTRMDAMMPSDLARISVYYDAGIRDFFNAQVSTNTLMANLLAKGVPVRLTDGFPVYNGLAPRLTNEAHFNINKIDFTQYGRAIYTRYGDVDLTEQVVESTGDGRHVGDVTQAINRAQMLLFFFGSLWPNGDRALASVDSDKSTINDMFTLSTGRVTPYSVVVPPGYFQPENATKKYPVVYLGHGYGMEPQDLAQVAIVAQNAMVDTRVDDQHRMPKFIIVLVDGKCRPGGDISNAPLPTDGDLCEEGTFYTDHADGPAKMEQGWLELESHIEANYRTLPEGDVMVTD